MSKGIIYTPRVRKSPFFEETIKSGATNFTTYNHMTMPVGYTTPEQEYHSLINDVTLWDVAAERQVEIIGEDAAKFVQYMTPRNLSTFKDGFCRYAFMTDEDGGIINDPLILKFNENKFWYVQADGPFEEWLLAHTSNFDVKISDPKSRVLQIQGPASIEIMKAASNGKIDENMPYFRSGFFDLGGQTLYVSRTGFTNELGFEIYSDGFKTDHLALWDHLIKCGKPHGMDFSPTRAMTLRRIEAGIFGNLTDIDTTMTPFEAGLEFFVNMEKGDFIGRDALLDKDRRPCLFGLTCKTETPVSGSKVMDG